ncbi:hypothetical protein PIB30_013662 [Stylosanthes scabra]|uniref:Uncharacterized protein n=1 Tax=Stylosanthes scabra TaxID=79078 RepID=A0ABU6V868_9FABA|nr:hypothetical protein [Stylosanthes scabra]
MVAFSGLDWRETKKHTFDSGTEAGNPNPIHSHRYLITTTQTSPPLNLGRLSQSPAASRRLAPRLTSPRRRHVLLIEPSLSFSVEAIASRPYPFHRSSPLGLTSRNLTSFRRSITDFRRSLASFHLSHTPPSQPRLSPSRPRLNT